MHALRHHHLCTLEDYFEVELESERRFEFREGAILAMSGGSMRHDDIGLNAVTALRARLPSGCRPFGSNLRLVTGDGVYTYADAGAVCGKRLTTKYRGTDTLHNPMIVVEVLSPTTREYDLGEKLDHYRTTPSIHEILLIEAENIGVLHVRRTETGWQTLRFESREDTLELACGIRLPLAEIYDLPVEE